MTRLRYLLALSFAFIGIMSVNAATCGYEEKAKLNSESANVKANYEIKQRILDKSEYTPPDSIIGTDEEETYVATVDYIQVNILNLTENMYVEVTNDYDKNKVTYNYSDAQDGNITFNWEDIDSLVTYTIKVYASSNTGCADTVLKTLYLPLPRYNEYSSYDRCTLIPDYYLCQRYVNFDPVDFGDFTQKTDEQIEKLDETGTSDEPNQKWYQKVGDFVAKHKVAFISGGIVLIVAAGTTAVIVIRRRGRSVI